MKRLLFFVIAMVFFNSGFSQEIPELKLTPVGVEPVIVNLNGLNAAEIYSKTLDWVQETYKNPDEVLKANIENKKIRLIGFVPNGLTFRNMVVINWGVSYILEISFKEGKCRYHYVIDHFTGSDGTPTAITYKDFYKKNGQIRKSYIPAVSSLEKTMNDLLQSYYNYVSGKTDSEDDNW